MQCSSRNFKLQRNMITPSIDIDLKVMNFKCHFVNMHKTERTWFFL